MKILIIAGRDPYTHLGGTEKVIIELAEGFAKRGHSVLITLNGTWQKREIDHGITVIPFTTFWLPVICDFQYAWKIRQYTKRLQPDLVIDHSSIAFLNPMNFRTVTVVHGTNLGNAHSRSLTSLSEVGTYMFRLFRALLQYTMFLRCHRVIAVSEKVKREIIDFYRISWDKILAIDNGTRYSLTDTEKRERMQRSTMRTGIFLSSHHIWKGIAIIESLAAIMPDCRFLICGGPYTPRHTNVEYRWNLSEKETFAALKESDFLILPSQYEGQALAVLEAMSVWLVIVWGEEIDPAIGEPEKIGILLDDRTDIQEYKRSIIDLESHREKLHVIQAYNLDLMEDYTWEKQGEKYLREIQHAFPELRWK